jgi:hypothetical protein
MAANQLADGTAVGPHSHSVPDPKQPALSFYDMLAHAGHDLTIKTYRAGTLTVETALVCRTCGRELRTASNPTINAAIEFRCIALYVDAMGQNKAMPFMVKSETWNGRRAAVDETVYSRILKERVQSILIEDNTNPALFDAFWSELQS